MISRRDFLRLSAESTTALSLTSNMDRGEAFDAVGTRIAKLTNRLVHPIPKQTPQTKVDYPDPNHY